MTKIMVKVAPSQKETKRRRTSILPSILSLQRQVFSLDSRKFDDVMATDFTSGFEESGEYFSEIGTKAASLVGARNCNIFILDDKEHRLYTFMKDDKGEYVTVIKPVDRGITGSVLSDAIGMNAIDVCSCSQWSLELDDVYEKPTKSYLAWPLWDTSTGTCIGVVEFHNKEIGGSLFDVADSQMARIIAFQLGRAVVHYRQQTILDGHNKAINMAYENDSESITIDDTSRSMANTTICANSSSPAKVPNFKRVPAGLYRNATFLSPWKSFASGNTVMDNDYAYDVFTHNDEELTMHAINIFDERGLFSRFSIPLTTFVNFVNEIKLGYSRDAPYHNHLHAFDVMHVCHLFIKDCKADEFLDSCNILSILVGALAHDLGHDGYNNAFHASTNSELAIMYNGVSILENYSAAYLFRILRKEKCNIFARLSDAEMTKMRSRLIDLILDTDAKNHFMLTTRFKHGMEMNRLPRGLLSSMILHVSDVSNPTRPGPIARKWAYAVQEEFFRQGDKEKELKLPRSPFMDREFENLPRMQGAFIDALVLPVFKLLAEFLPLINDHFIKTLNSNRIFWNGMQIQGIVTTDAIILHLTNPNNQEIYCQEIDDKNRLHSNPPSSEDPIPGIPANAPKETTINTRRLSMVSVRSQRGGLIVDPELGEIPGSNDTPHRHHIETNSISWQKIKTRLSIFLESIMIQTVLVLGTIYALFANDLNMAIGSKSLDHSVDIFTFIVFISFLLEIIASVICVQKYIHFFLWLDLAASISLLLEVDFLLKLGDVKGSTTELSMAKAGRAAKAGARAGRLAKLFRLVRLIKIAKLLRCLMVFSQRKATNTSMEDDLNFDDDVDMKTSVVGRKMTESITQKVIIAVMLMLATFSITELNFIPDARQLQLDALAVNPESLILREGFLRAHNNIISLTGLGADIINSARMVELRSIEILTLAASTNSSISGSFDLSEEMSEIAWYSIGTTLVVTILLAVLSMLFSRDAYNIMIRPIEKMKSTIQKLSENPLLHLEKMKKRQEVTESNETDLLEIAINKMAALLQVGFGCAGAEIIAKNLSDGELDPMIPGAKVNAIFGFCDIRDFTFATEQLQQDVMLFVNKIAQITHKHVVDSGGAPNKNIGDAFLLVWKLHSDTHGKRIKLQKHMFDSALTGVQNIISDIQQIGSVAEFMQDEKYIDACCMSSLEGFKVSMGFGLHTGWAIEGSIGSKVKVDASYLSPHVNLASRLESATKRYRVPLLMSDTFVSGLTGALQSTCRRIDKVKFKGCTESMIVLHQDVEPYQNLTEKPENYDDLLSATSWNNAIDVKALTFDVDEVVNALQSETYIQIRGVYDTIFNAYIDGKWGDCKILLNLWLGKFPGDNVIHVLTEYLITKNFDCPDDWTGSHVLDSK